MIAGAHIRSFVLRSGRMTAAQQRSYDALMPRYGVPGGDGVLDWNALWGRPDPPVVEIGFGSGAATAAIARANPGVAYLGIEVHRPGIGRLLWEIERGGIDNIRVAEGDAVEILERRVAPASVAAFHVFFPDPWPKTRHHKRRLMRRPFTGLLSSRLVPGGYVYMVTDWAGYAEDALHELAATAGLVNRYDGYAPPQTWRPETRFEARGRKQSLEIRELMFVRDGAAGEA